MGRLNLRQTIVIGIAIFTLAFGGIGLLSLSNINQLQQEIVLVERADDLRNLILEIRREEKNFFLYRDRSFFFEGKKNLQEAETALDALFQEIGRARGMNHREALEQGIVRYGELLAALAEMDGMPGENAPPVQALREAGQQLVEHSRAIAEFERESVLRINHKLRMTLIVSMGVVAMVVFALVIFVSKSILGPLRRVQDATRRIAQGTFVPLTVRNGHDEIQQVFVALNSMVEELKKRQTQLVQAQKLSSIGTLASGIAHQLNNPLNNISTSAQILAEETAGQSDFSDKMLGNITQETVRARDIVKGLLEFSRHKDFSPAPYPIASVVESAVRLVSSQIGPKITVNLDLPGNVTLLVDRQRLQEAFINLLINATQAIGGEEGVIDIKTYPENGHEVIVISDTGEGMSPDTLQRIFDPFFSTKEVGQGTGLGLFIVYGIVEKHGGTIRVESMPNQGTTFYIKLPLAAEDAA
ncbi:His Kinase A (phospho-acceptor) domain-containing protein [Paucidesulfovibrio gracilis DSM 16080]|uniref:histidine kinase n=1 Tax=Paucidesulfovibrio gracilis DSM 16080 TaxID=1121449 RepID=A0A1T4XDV6_9BACT|nr:HAMP domain-containing sensor histidine kinase [Paucidesulfovibrio gracilis]SKA87577.1 His Kinase A (phospho-acceptor) domain-containing protein [Paucidesulfovibrio gracilis DSM 16080]